MQIDINQPKVQLRDSDMAAYLFIPVEGNSHDYTYEELRDLLLSNHIVQGIDEDYLHRAVDKKLYGMEILVATGEESIDGQDGYYEYLFNSNCSKKPEILPDGSVNYHNMNVIESVNEGDVIAIYHPAIQGVDGYSVKGKLKSAKRNKDLPPLKGRGFILKEDGITYCAALGGKIDEFHGRIMITPTYVVNGDVNLSIGNIDFRGDVIIHGSVHAGETIKATGTITIDGVVDSDVNLIAKKDIVLKSGMMGDNRGIITTEGDLYCKFIEYSTINVAGKIEGEAFLNCNVTCGGQMIVVGNKGRLVGGVIRAVSGIIANSVGSRTEKRTELQLGIRAEQLRRLKLLEHKIEATKQGLKNLEKEKRDYQLRLKKPNRSEKSMQDKETIFLRRKIKEEAVLSRDEMEIEGLRVNVEKSQNATARILRQIYPGVSISINDITVNVQEEHRGVEFTRHGANMRMEKL